MLEQIAVRSDVRTLVGLDGLALQEFRLHAADADGTVARLVTTASYPAEGWLPLLISVDDPRDVATLRAVLPGAPDIDRPGDNTVLGRLVETWQPVRRYVPRVSDGSGGTPGSFRLAVTESGINDEQVAPPSPRVGEGTGEPIALLWIGRPEGSHAGLLVLIGRYGDGPPASNPDSPSWPLPLSRDLGVRVYESARGDLAV